MTRPEAADEAPGFWSAATRLAEAVVVYDPTLVIYFGPDHRRAMSEVLPPFTVPDRAEGFGDWNTPQGAYDVPADLTRALCAWLLDHDIDVATAPFLKLDHGFGLTMSQLFERLDAVRTLPVVLNCIGLTAPARRAALLGTLVQDFVRENLDPDERVLVLASGGLSHSPPTLTPGFGALDDAGRRMALDRARALVRPDWDQDFLARLGGGDWRSLAAISDAQLDDAGSGAHEVRSWIAAAFAGGRPLVTLSYEPVRDWITGMAVAATASLMAPHERIRHDRQHT